MEDKWVEHWKWLIGLIVVITGMIAGWIAGSKNRNNNTHKDIYEKLSKKADIDFVNQEINKITDNLNTRLESHVHESQAVNELLLRAIDSQKDMMSSMDGKLNILIENQIKK
jgi:hypothetical protein